MLNIDEITQEQLEALTVEWQEHLRLRDWRIEVTLARRDQSFDGALGDARINYELKQARIRILDPIDFHTEHEFNKDIEATLVHELVHIHFELCMPSATGDNPTLKILAEQSVEQMAQALVELKRTGAAGQNQAGL